MRGRWFALVLMACWLPAVARAEPPLVVVELFTSQGCSSCPPADAFLNDLAQLRADVLPLTFHVTYWNNLGWADPFSLPEATARQRDYAGWLGESGVYTPQMVVDGARGFVGSDRARGLAEIARAGRAGAGRVTVGLSRDATGVLITVAGGTGHARVLLVGFDAEHRTAVGRGENGGRTLRESNIVRSLVPAGWWTGAKLYLHRAVPDGEQVAVLLQSDDGRIIGAARLSKTT